MDPLSITLGALPICFSAVQGFVTIRAKLKELRGHGQEVKRLRKKLRIQTMSFKHELRLLIGTVLSSQDTSKLLEEKAPSESQTQSAEILLREYLGPEEYEEFKETAVEAEEAIANIEDKLSIYAAPGEKVPWNKATKNALNVAFKIKGYREEIDTLRETVEILKQLRKYAKSRRQQEVARDQEVRSPAPSQESSDLVQRLQKARTDASGFHKAWKCAPPCDDAMHSRHSIKLMLHQTLIPSSSGETKLALLFEFEGGNNSTMVLRGRSLFQAAPKSQLTNGVHTQQPTNGGGYYHAASHHRPQHHDPPPTEPPAAKRPKLAGRPAVTSTNIIITTTSPVPTFSTPSLCRFLSEPKPSSAHPPPSLLMMNRFTVNPLIQDVSLDGRRVHLAELLSRPVNDVARNVDRIELALTLVYATLQHWGTAWWTKGCLLSAVEVLEQPGVDEDLAAYLKTLHIAEQGASHDNDDDDTDMDDPIDGGGTNARGLHRFLYEKGVRNLDLYCLGVALLQIGLWERVSWDQFSFVRRKVKGLGFLGERYMKATKKLIYCDFGVGEENLREEKLQLAICESVIADLESLRKDCQIRRRKLLR